MVCMHYRIGVQISSCAEKEALIVAKMTAGWRRGRSFGPLSDPFGEVGECNVGRNWRSVSAFELVEHQKGF